ncbi:acyltransferase [Roseateles sp. GG27B]
MKIRGALRDIYDICRDAGRRSILLAVCVLPGKPGNQISDAARRGLLQLLGVEVGKGSQVSPGFFVFNNGKTRFGQECRIGYRFEIWDFKPVIVGKRLLASHNVSLICGTHTTDQLRSNVPGPITIGDDVWIGANVVIVGPAVIGDRVIIGANSFVTGDIPSDAKFGGSPAKPLHNANP